MQKGAWLNRVTVIKQQRPTTENDIKIAEIKAYNDVRIEKIRALGKDLEKACTASYSEKIVNLLVKI